MNGRPPLHGVDPSKLEMESNQNVPTKAPDKIDARQKIILFKYFKAHPYLMLQHFTESFSKEDSAVLWFQLAQKLNNATPEFSDRSWKQWEQLWSGFSQELPHKLILTELEFNLLELLKRAKTLPFEELFCSNLSQPLPIKKNGVVTMTINFNETDENLNKVVISEKNYEDQTQLHSTSVNATKLTILEVPNGNETNQSIEMLQDVFKINESVQGIWIPELEQKRDEAREEIKFKQMQANENHIEDVKSHTSETILVPTQDNANENEFSEGDSTDTEMNKVDDEPEIEEQIETLTTNEANTESLVRESRKLVFLESAGTSNHEQAVNEHPSNMNQKGRLSNMEKALIKKFIKSDVIKMKYLKRKLKMENEYHKRKLTLMRDLLLLKKRKIKVEETQATALMRISRSLHRFIQNPQLRPEQQ